MHRTPFEVSTEAASWIAEKACEVDLYPQLRGMIPCLTVVLRAESVDKKTGRRLEVYEGEFVDVAFDYPESLTDEEALVFNGIVVYSCPDTLEYLTGKRLVVEEIQVGWPIPSEKKGTVVRAV